jgi:uncharacterized protein (TIGR02246 family)
MGGVHRILTRTRRFVSSPSANYLEVTMSRTFIPFILLLTVLVAACNEAPTTLLSTGAANVSEARMGSNPPGQMAQIEALENAWEAAWEAKDAAAFAANYAEDAEMINPIGGILSGREAIRAQHALLFAGPFATSTLTVDPRRIEFLTGTIAIVYLDMTFTGFSGLPGGLRATEPGVLRGRITWVVMKQGGKWQIVSQQMTPFPPLP